MYFCHRTVSLVVPMCLQGVDKNVERQLQSFQKPWCSDFCFITTVEHHEQFLYTYKIYKYFKSLGNFTTWWRYDAHKLTNGLVYYYIITISYVYLTRSFITCKTLCSFYGTSYACMKCKSSMEMKNAAVYHVLTGKVEQRYSAGTVLPECDS